MRSLRLSLLTSLWFTVALGAFPYRLHRRSESALASSSSTVNSTSSTSSSLSTASSVSSSTQSKGETTTPIALGAAVETPTPIPLGKESITSATTTSSSRSSSSSSSSSSSARAINFIDLGDLGLDLDFSPSSSSSSTSTVVTPTPIPLGKVSAGSTSASSSASSSAGGIKLIDLGGLDLDDPPISSSVPTTTEKPTPIPLGTAAVTSQSSARAPSLIQISLEELDPELNPTPASLTLTGTGGGALFPTGDASASQNGPTPPYPFSNATSTGLGPTGTGRGKATGTAADVCGGCTVNVRGASVDYWLPPTFSYGLGTLRTAWSNDTETSWYTLEPATTTFDAAAAIASGAYTTSEIYFPEFDFYMTVQDSYTLTPVAVSTALVSRSSVLPVTGTVAMSDVDYLFVDPGPATVAVPLPSGTVSIATSTTPFVYFSAYEVERHVATTDSNGRLACATSVSTFNMSKPFAFDYKGDSLEQASAAQGVMPDNFLQQIPQSSCVAGNWAGEVNVLIVVDLLYDIEFNASPFIQHVESSVSAGFPEQSFQPELGHLASSTKGNTDSQPTGSGSSINIGDVIGSILDGNKPSSTAAGGGRDDDTPANAGGATAGVNGGSNNGGSNNGGGNNGGGNNGGSPVQTTPVPAIPVQAASSARPSTVVIGSQTAVVGQSSQVVIGGQTLTPGGPAITVDNTPISLAPSATAIIIKGSTAVVQQASSGAAVVVVPSPAPTAAPVVPVLTIGSNTITGNAATQFFFGPGSTLTPGGTVVVGGTTVSLDPSASFVVVGGSTQVLPTAASTAPSFTIGGSTIVGNSGNTFVVGGQTVTPGSPAITVNGPNGQTTISVAQGGSSVVINGNTQAITPLSTPAPLTLGGSTFSAVGGSTFVVGSQTLTPGGVITFTDAQGHATTVSLGPSASFAVINGVTTTLASGAMITQAPVLTIDGSLFSAQPGSGTTYLVGGKILTPGGQIIVTGADGQLETISLLPGASAIVINRQTTLLNNAGAATNAPLLTVGGIVYTALPGGTTYVIDGQTLVPGSSIVVSGTTISLSPYATALIINGHTTTLFPATTTRQGSTTATASRTGVSVETPLETGAGAAATTTKKGAASSLQHSSGFTSTIAGAIMALSALWL